MLSGASLPDSLARSQTEHDVGWSRDSLSDTTSPTPPRSLSGRGRNFKGYFLQISASLMFYFKVDLLKFPDYVFIEPPFAFVLFVYLLKNLMVLRA